MKRVSPLFTAKLRLWWMTRPPGSVRVMPCARKLAWEGSASAGWRARGEIITGPWGRARWGALHGAGGGARGKEAMAARCGAGSILDGSGATAHRHSPLPPHCPIPLSHPAAAPRTRSRRGLGGRGRA